MTVSHGWWLLKDIILFSCSNDPRSPTRFIFMHLCMFSFAGVLQTLLVIFRLGLLSQQRYNHAEFLILTLCERKRRILSSASKIRIKLNCFAVEECDWIAILIIRLNRPVSTYSTEEWPSFTASTTKFQPIIHINPVPKFLSISRCFPTASYPSISHANGIWSSSRWPTLSISDGCETSNVS